MSSRTYYQSPLGLLEIEGTSRGVSSIRFAEEKKSQEEEIPGVLTECVRQLDEYFQRKRQKFTVKLDLSTATVFYREVWRMVQAIPYGRTRTYQAIARTLERPAATRAVGQANGRNPIPIVIPCHRVIGKSGDLTGYAYGLKMKEALLAIENPKRYAPQAELFEIS